jgi:hypothetical protein
MESPLLLGAVCACGGGLELAVMKWLDELARTMLRPSSIHQSSLGRYLGDDAAR